MIKDFKSGLWIGMFVAAAILLLPVLFALRSQSVNPDGDIYLNSKPPDVYAP